MPSHCHQYLPLLSYKQQHTHTHSSRHSSRQYTGQARLMQSTRRFNLLPSGDHLELWEKHSHHLRERQNEWELSELLWESHKQCFYGTLFSKKTWIGLTFLQSILLYPISPALCAVQCGTRDAHKTWHRQYNRSSSTNITVYVKIQ